MSDIGNHLCRLFFRISSHFLLVPYSGMQHAQAVFFLH
uniref:Uncharacterized protein n=1 Tax=Anguilla anguilla TaxID=7936 RepID=A0A0E9VTG5_ANGAN